MSLTITYLISLISLTLLVILWFWIYQNYRTDVLREELFKLRDDLFDEACKGNITFDAPAYGAMRTSVNGLIRFSHRVNIYQGLLLYFMWGKEDKQYVNKVSFTTVMQENMKSLTDEQKKLIDKYMQRMNFSIGKHLILSSILFMLLFVGLIVISIVLIIPMIIIFFLKDRIIEYKEKFIIKLLNRLDTAALATGELS